MGEEQTQASLLSKQIANFTVTSILTDGSVEKLTVNTIVKGNA